MKFQLESEYKPAGDQPEAIDQLCSALESGVSDVTLLGSEIVDENDTVRDMQQLARDKWKKRVVRPEQAK